MQEKKVQKVKSRGDVVADLIIKHRYTRVAEVGVLKGDTARRVHERCEAEGCPVERYYAVDRKFGWPFFEWAQVHPTPELIILPMLSTEAANHILEPLDLVYIDADHTEKSVREDVKFWAPKVRSGGIVCGHDYDFSKFPGVTIAVDEYFGRENIETIPVRGGAHGSRGCDVFVYRVK